MGGVLQKDGGISFSRTPKAKEKEPEKEIEEPKRLDTEELLKQERLNAKLSQAKRIQGSGFAINGSVLIGSIFYLDSLLLSNDFVANLNMINDMFGLEIDFEKAIAIIQEWKSQIIGFVTSSQLMIMQYKQTVQKMKDTGNESFYDAFNKELEKAGI